MDFPQVGTLAGQDIVSRLILMLDASELGNRVMENAVLDGEPFLCGKELVMAVCDRDSGNSSRSPLNFLAGNELCF